MSDRVVAEYQPEGRAKRRLVFTPFRGNWQLSEEVQTEDGDWRTVGGEVVESISFEGVPAECIPE